MRRGNERCVIHSPFFDKSISLSVTCRHSCPNTIRYIPSISYFIHCPHIHLCVRSILILVSSVFTMVPSRRAGTPTELSTRVASYNLQSLLGTTLWLDTGTFTHYTFGIPVIVACRPLGLRRRALDGRSAPPGYCRYGPKYVELHRLSHLILIFMLRKPDNHENSDKNQRFSHSIWCSRLPWSRRRCNPLFSSVTECA